MTCDRFQAAVLASDDVVVDLTRQGTLAAHAAHCADCRGWVAAYAEGAAEWLNGGADDLTGGVVAMTSGTVCQHARRRLTAAPDARLEADAAALVASHLARCGECRAFVSAWTLVSAALPTLAESDPGPGFAAAVIARTSRRPAAAWRGRLRALGSRLVRRPRFAWEVAYVVTLCWLLVVGSPVAVLDWTTARLGAVAADTVPAGVRDARGHVQARVQTWREWLDEEVARASGAVGDGTVAAGDYARGVQDRVAQTWTRAVSGIGDLLASSWQAVVEWVTRVFGGRGSDPREPPATPARSSQ